MALVFRLLLNFGSNYILISCYYQEGSDFGPTKNFILFIEKLH